MAIVDVFCSFFQVLTGGFHDDFSLLLGSRRFLFQICSLSAIVFCLLGLIV